MIAFIHFGLYICVSNLRQLFLVYVCSQIFLILVHALANHDHDEHFKLIIFVSFTGVVIISFIAFKLVMDVTRIRIEAKINAAKVSIESVSLFERRLRDVQGFAAQTNNEHNILYDSADRV